MVNTRSVFAPKVEIPGRLYAALSTLSVAVVLGTWCLLTYGGITNPDFLAAPHEIAIAGWKRILNASLFEHMSASLVVILSGFALASILSAPLGIMSGSFQFVAALVEPNRRIYALYSGQCAYSAADFVDRYRYRAKNCRDIPWHIFPAIDFCSPTFRRGLAKTLSTARITLGANQRQVVFRVLLPACMPGVMDNLRVTMGWAWTYLVVAEIVAANSGLGYMILNAMRGLFTDVILLGVFTIGLLGLLTDVLFKIARRHLLPWSASF